jgi:hypothetical protein
MIPNAGLRGIHLPSLKVFPISFVSSRIQMTRALLISGSLFGTLFMEVEICKHSSASGYIPLDGNEFEQKEQNHQDGVWWHSLVGHSNRVALHLDRINESAAPQKHPTGFPQPHHSS